MRAKILIFSLFSFSISFGQKEIDSEWANRVAPIFEGLNKSRVPHGIIYERVLPLANLYGFNRDENFNIARFSYFKQALSEMHRASNGTKFMSLQSFKEAAAQNVAENEVYLAILNTDFHILNYNEDNPLLGGLLFNETAEKFMANGKHDKGCTRLQYL